MSLKKYREKRDFKKTSEPPGKISRQHKNLFVIQKHAASHLHYDFRIELKGVLLSWAVPKGPCLDPTVKRLAMHVEDHPVAYGHFEGIIPKGEYGGGTVMLWDIGTWKSLDEDPVAAYKNGHLHIELNAKKLKGIWNLFRLKNKDDKSWFLVKAKDKYARPLAEYDVLEKKKKSVLTGYDLNQIAKKEENVWSSKKGLKKKPKKKLKINLPTSKMPSIISPQLATLADEAPVGHQWLHEIKFDGYRILAFIEKNNIRLMSRNNNEWTQNFKNIAIELNKYFRNQNIIFDGEVVLLDKSQHSSFQLLQNAIDENENKPFIYYIFDLLYYDKYNVMSLTLLERKNLLKQILPKDNFILRLSDHVIASGKEVLKKACEMHLEGIISKDMQSIYQQKRTKTWVKSKCMQRQEFLIGGFTKPMGRRSFFGSLYLGYYDKKGVFKYCGNVGTGFNQASLENIYQKLKKNIIEKNPFDIKPPGITTATWVKPVLIAEIEFIEWTNGGRLRHPSFKGLRMDKSPKKITREKKISVKKIKSEVKPKLLLKKIKLSFKLTHPDKILYPEDRITKQDIANYYDNIAEWILPYIVNRPLTLVRSPENYKKTFYQKHLMPGSPIGLFQIKIKEKNKTDNYIYIKDREGLMGIVQMSALEIHPWGSRIEDYEYPDMIIFDVDPAPDVPWKKVIEAAVDIQENLLKIKLKSFVKTTGGKGLHVVVPIKPEHDWGTIKEFAHAFVLLLEENNPQKYVTVMTKAKRKGKIYLDYLRNQRGATSVAAYSIRSRVHAPVSVPLAWDELSSNFKDNFYTLRTVGERLRKLKKDPWQDFFKVKQQLKI